MQKCLFCLLVLAYGNEILNTTETSLDDKNETCEKYNCLVHAMEV